MADEATLDSQHEHPNHPEPEGTPPRGGSNLGWIFVVAAIGALVYIPAVLTGDQGGWRSQQLTDTFTVTDMDHVPVTDVFADTPALEVTDVAFAKVRASFGGTQYE